MKHLDKPVVLKLVLCKLRFMGRYTHFLFCFLEEIDAHKEEERVGKFETYAKDCLHNVFFVVLTLLICKLWWRAKMALYD